MGNFHGFTYYICDAIDWTFFNRCWFVIYYLLGRLNKSTFYNSSHTLTNITVPVYVKGTLCCISNIMILFFKLFFTNVFISFRRDQIDTNVEYTTKLKQAIELYNNYDGRYRGVLMLIVVHAFTFFGYLYNALL